MTQRFPRGTAALVLALSLAACAQPNPPKNGPPPPPPAATPAEAAGSASAALSSTSSVAGGVQAEVAAVYGGLGRPSAAPSGIVAGLLDPERWLQPLRGPGSDLGLKGLLDSLPGLAAERAVPQAAYASTLLTGVYDCTPRACTFAGPSEDLVYRSVTSAGQAATETFDWNGSSTGAPSAPVRIWLADVRGDTYYSEYPTKAVYRLEVGTVRLADFTLNAAWHPKTGEPGVYVVTPDSLSVSGFFQKTDGTRLVELTKLNLAIGGSGVTTSADLTLRAKGDRLRLTWNVALRGTVLRDAAGNLAGFQASGTSRFEAGLEINDRALALAFDASDFSQAPPSVRLANGRFTADGKLVTFSGVLDDANNNCVPGENLTLVFASGTSSLENFLVGNGYVRPCRR